MARKKVVIIGTGAGGLSAAAKLAQSGYDVVALERGKQLGGFLNPFARKHYHFDPGVHYVGQCRPGEPLHRMLRAVGLDAEELFVEMDPDRFDTLRFPGFEMKICAGLDRYQERLNDAFPDDRKDIDAYFDLLRLANDLSKGQRPQRLSYLKAAPSLLRVRGTFQQLLEGMIKNPKLRTVLAGQCGDFGLPPDRAPAILGLGVALHFADGGFFPRGGSGGLRDALVDAARQHGAVFHRRAEVTKIHVKNGAVRAVELANGDQLEADIVVSAVDPTITYGEFIDPEHLPKKILAKARRTQASVGSICVFLGLRRDLREHGLGNFNVWDYPSWDLNQVYGDIVDGKMPEEWPFFLSPNSLKDDTNSMAPEGCSTLEVVTLAPFAPFKKWQGQKSFKRGDEYMELKEKMSDSVLRSVEKRWPGLVGDVQIHDVATPVTNTHYCNTPEGSIYGPASTPEQFGLNSFRPWGPLKGLFLAGAGTLGPGVGTCLASGIAAAQVVRKRDRGEKKSFLSFARPKKLLRASLGAT